jgi:hypothetical protein
MLRVTVELMTPGGRRKVLATADVGLMNGGAVGRYDVLAAEADNPMSGRDAWHRRFTIDNHDRNSSVWRLLEKIARAGGDVAETP